MQARALHDAWRANATDVAQRLPHSAALLSHPTRAALARTFAKAAACLLKHEGGPSAAALAAAGDLDALAASVVSWPQVLSYDTPERMPTGRETSLPGTLMRGVFIAREVGDVVIDTYDPRGPLDSMEIQDTINDMYRCAAKPAASIRRPSCYHTPCTSWPRAMGMSVLCYLFVHVTSTHGAHACMCIPCSHTCMVANVGLLR